jgi:hypothetical protein
LFYNSQDANHEGLRPAGDVPEVDLPPMHTDRSLNRQDAFGLYKEEHNVFNKDVGGSGSSSFDEERVL